MQSYVPKQYMHLDGRPIMEHTLSRLLETSWITGIVVALGRDDNYWQSLSMSNDARIKTVEGGQERVDSVWNALCVIKDQLQDNDFILVHDAARPCLGEQDLQNLHQAMSDADAGLVLAAKLTDTIKRDDGNSAVLKTVPRNGLWRALTPQIFPKALLVKALLEVKDNSISGITDEASAVEHLGLSPRLVQGNSNNIKITTVEDIHLASMILNAQRELQQCE